MGGLLQLSAFSDCGRTDKRSQHECRRSVRRKPGGDGWDAFELLGVGLDSLAIAKAALDS